MKTYYLVLQDSKGEYYIEPNFPAYSKTYGDGSKVLGFDMTPFSTGLDDDEGRCVEFNREDINKKDIFTSELKANAYLEGLSNKCPLCDTGHKVLRHGPYSDFIGCSNYPGCKYTEKLE